MSKQMTIRIPDDLAERLERRAQRMRRKRTELMRMALEEYLDKAPSIEERKTAYQRATELKLIGAVESGIPDLGSKHREHLEEMGFGRENNYRK